MKKTTGIISHALSGIMLLIIFGCGRQVPMPAEEPRIGGKSDSTASQKTDEPVVLQTTKVEDSALPVSSVVQVGAESDKHVELSDVTDPSGLAHLFFGQIVAIGYGSNMAVDDGLKILLTGALADEIEGDITPEALRGAYKKATLLSIENGDAVWEGRTLPAVLITVDISTVNRIAGKYNHICMKLGGIRDVEFNFIRNPKYIFCDKNKMAADENISFWKRSVSFKTTSNY